MVDAGRIGPWKDSLYVDRTRTERLIALLHAQRSEAARRSGEVRGTPSWSESSDRLDELNDQIMHVGSFGSLTREIVGSGLELDLDSRPVDDVPFRRHVVDSIRNAVIATRNERTAMAAPDRPAATAERVRQMRALMRRAEMTIHELYPDASLAADPYGTGQEPGAIFMRADRDGAVA
jgi:hypothetical protein